MNQFINMILHMVMRRLISKGMNKGFDMATNRRRKRDDPKGAGHGVSEEDRKEMAALRQKEKRTKQAMRITRRIGRF
ncbi:MAG: hypothetical protein AAFP13_00535 [Pseudomonadota bacterium]